MSLRSDFNSRLERLREGLGSAGLDGVVIVPGPNLRYLTGVNSLLLERPFMLLVPRAGTPNLIVPALESGPYIRGPLEAEIHGWTDSQGSAGAVRAGAKGAKVGGRWGVEGKVPYLFLSKLMKATRSEFEDAEPILQGLREIKDEAEVRLLKRAGRILSKSFELFPGFVKAGATELEVARRAIETIYEQGGTKVDDLLVQTGARAADPHGLPSSKKLVKGEGVIIDIGMTFDGYYSDITRTYSVGRSEGLEDVYARVLEAELKGIAASKEDARTGDIDMAARGVLEKAGLGKYFIHRTGHGLGLEVHEAPYIVEGGKEKLREGMCFTVEPGAYIRGKLGVRIEDNVLIEGGKGVEITDVPKDYGWWM